MTTILSLHGQLPAAMAQTALTALAVPIDSTRFPLKPMDWVRLGVVASATTILCAAGQLPPSFAIQAVMALVFPGDPTRWRKGGSTL